MTTVHMTDQVKNSVHEIMTHQVTDLAGGGRIDWSLWFGLASLIVLCITTT